MVAVFVEGLQASMWRHRWCRGCRPRRRSTAIATKSGAFLDMVRTRALVARMCVRLGAVGADCFARQPILKDMRLTCGHRPSPVSGAPMAKDRSMRSALSFSLEASSCCVARCPSSYRGTPARSPSRQACVCVRRLTVGAHPVPSALRRSDRLRQSFSILLIPFPAQNTRWLPGPARDPQGRRPRKQRATLRQVLSFHDEAPRFRAACDPDDGSLPIELLRGPYGATALTPPTARHQPPPPTTTPARFASPLPSAPPLPLSSIVVCGLRFEV